MSFYKQSGNRVNSNLAPKITFCSAFPFINPNQNTGNPVATDIEWKIALQTVYHDSLHPSHILLPVMPLPKQ